MLKYNSTSVVKDVGFDDSSADEDLEQMSDSNYSLFYTSEDGNDDDDDT
jgi:hypothetical protein